MDPIPFRLRLGLIGHRHLENPELAAQAVRDLLHNRLLTDLALEPSTSRKTPIVFAAVTNLADGADRVLANVVLEEPGACLEVILPFAADLYRKTMGSDAQREDFDTMLAKDRSPRVLRQETQPFDEESRALAYRDGARELLNNCDVLIAVWDQKPARGPGGTGETVGIARGRGRPLYIVSPEGNVIFEAGHGLDQKPLQGLEAFNSAPEPAPEFLKAVQGSELMFLQPPHCQPVPEPHRQAIQSILFPAYMRASALARKNQRTFQRAALWLCILAPLSVLCVAVAVTFGHEYETELIVGEAILLLGVALLVWGAGSRFQEKWMTNRFLAERLRGAFFLAACGLDPLPIDVPPHLGLAHRPGDWPVRAFNEIWLRMPLLVRCAGDGCDELVEFVREHWVKDQIEFHESRARRWGIRSKVLEWAGNILFVLTFIAAIAHLLPYTHAHEAFGNFLVVLAIAFPAYGAALAAYRGYRGFERLEKRSELMVESLKDLHQRIATVRTASQLQQRMREMETLSLRETQDWLMLVRFTHLEAA